MKRFSISYPNVLFYIFILFFLPNNLWANNKPIDLISPNKNIKVSVWTNAEGEVKYNILYKGNIVLEESKLGLNTSTQDFSSNLSYQKVSANRKISKSYQAIQGKRKANIYNANERVVTWKNVNNKLISICFQLSDDGLIFKYIIPEYTSQPDVINKELTSYNFLNTAKAWIQPVAVSKSGWEQTNPSYEEHYQKEIPVGTKENTKTGWVYPALFESNDAWVLITESGLERNHCATRLHYDSPEGEYSIAFPDDREVIMNKNLFSKVEKGFESPWRVVAVGDLKTIIESDLGNAAVQDSNTSFPSFIKSGKASWSWINSKDDFIVYEEQKKYIDFAADMNWQYCLIDVNWDTKIGYDRIKALSEYAKEKNVGLILWYNSAGDWNTVGYTPKNILVTKEKRREEFKKIHDLGIKGVKIDFFGGDGQSVIEYYLDILADAADYELLVNFHGATLPRSWATQYPHLMTVEAVRGFENVTFTQEDADRQAEICSILPFTRNVYDPMDYTPMNLSKVRSHVKRKTTAAFELATSVIFLSGIQHYAESPEGMKDIPNQVQDYLRQLPNQWEDTKFLSGYPGKDIVVARKGNGSWYIAGINGENKPKNIDLDLTGFISEKVKLQILDDESVDKFKITADQLSKKVTIPVKANGGFVIVMQ